ncbi:MAG TPA: hypothetical protein VLF87_02365 [Patescibacteria group bacterium]|nr:hypothetical protein [Patescibacteria group bacterium]
MFTNLTIGFLAGAGFAGWVYSKLYRSSGGNSRNAAIGALCAGLAVMVILTAILSAVFKK